MSMESLIVEQSLQKAREAANTKSRDMMDWYDGRISAVLLIAKTSNPGGDLHVAAQAAQNEVRFLIKRSNMHWNY